MAPTLSYGDRILVDAGTIEIDAAGGVYAFADGDTVRIMRACKRIGSGKVDIWNDNPAYSHFTVPANELLVLRPCLHGCASNRALCSFRQALTLNPN